MVSAAEDLYLKVTDLHSGLPVCQLVMSMYKCNLIREAEWHKLEIWAMADPGVLLVFNITEKVH